MTSENYPGTYSDSNSGANSGTNSNSNYGTHSGSFKKLPPRAIRIWQISSLFTSLLLVAIPVVLWFVISAIALWILILAAVLAVLIFLFRLLWLPYAIWKRWRYRISDTDIHLRRGVFVSRETVIPLSRVQHVDTSQGPFLRHFGLSELSISTAATTHSIPNLDTVIAERIRSTISIRAQLAEDDV